jgi:hypothetical protein
MKSKKTFPFSNRNKDNEFKLREAKSAQRKWLACPPLM